MSKDVFIIGSKGIPANYGGFETFVDNLVKRQENKNIRYHVACMDLKREATDYEYYGASCHEIKVLNIGSGKAILYDLEALNWALKTIKENNLKNGIIYVLACRVGPFIHSYIEKFHKFGFQVWVNPDGHEWRRAKWALPVRKYWKISEKLMIKNADYIVCDSEAIESYIKMDYAQFSPKTKYIAYGADIEPSKLDANDIKVKKWYERHNIKLGNYFLIVGRFVPENNYETMIIEFIKSNVKMDLVIITNIEHNKFYEELKNKTNFNKDNRIKFVGTVYDQELLKFIRENAFAYIHGHSVGGTNPSLLEALGSTKLNLLFDVEFNKEVGKSGALYWNKQNGTLSELLNKTTNISREVREKLAENAKARIINSYSWKKIIEEYEKEFLKN